ncbi:MAG: hypothetical protein LBK44_04445, partial [Spirochaetales bacterium]|nr:hypothetical protein [Spirochaetales bacterium]
MKKKTTTAWLLVAGLIFLAGCGSSPPSSEQAKAAPLFEGEGGKGMHLAVLEPEGKGLAKDEQYLTNFVQGILTSDLNRVTAMTIIDRQNLDTIISEQVTLSGVTEDDAIKIGKITNVQLVLTGELLKTRSGFSLQLAVSEVNTAERRASFTANTTAAELENAAPIKDGVVELLSKLDIHLTEEGRKLLYGAERKTVEAETALSKGIMAQKSGTVVEALSYYYNAASFDPTLAEAAGRLSVLSGTVSGGNFGQNARNAIQQRAEWLKVLKEAAAFFTEHPPYEIVYDPTLTEGEVNFGDNTLALSFDLALYPTASFEILNNILAGLNRTGRKKDWGFEGWPFGGEGAVSWGWSNFEPMPRQAMYGEVGQVEYEGSEAVYTGAFWVKAALLDDKGKVIDTDWGRSLGGEIRADGSRIRGNNKEGRITFHPKADDITDTLTVKITEINGMDAQAVGRAGYMQISATGTAYKIGDRGPAGGIIFFTMGGSGWRYLEAAPADLPDAEWGPDDVDIATETRIGSGKKNTELIVAKLRELGETGMAAQLCAGYEVNGFKDWFLPS